MTNDDMKRFKDKLFEIMVDSSKSFSAQDMDMLLIEIPEKLDEKDSFPLESNCVYCSCDAYVESILKSLGEGDYAGAIGKLEKEAECEIAYQKKAGIEGSVDIRKKCIVLAVVLRSNMKMYKSLAEYILTELLKKYAGHGN